MGALRFVALRSGRVSTRLTYTVLSVFIALLFVGCATVLDVSSYGLSSPWSNRVVNGEGFKHRVVFSEGVGNRLHVYIDGDGQPWETRVTRAANPTPERALMLELMALDSRPAVYLGRPCYFVKKDPRCDDSKWWTSHRYSQEVVASLSQALDSLSHGYDSLVLIGHSGGGTLAFLLAERRSDVSVLVTLAANLDLTQWARLHSFGPLYGSLNPASFAPLPERIAQYHFLGDRDGNVPPQIIRQFVQRQTSAHFEILPGVDHTCCWAGIWLDLMRRTEVE